MTSHRKFTPMSQRYVCIDFMMRHFFSAASLGYSNFIWAAIIKSELVPKIEKLSLHFMFENSSIITRRYVTHSVHRCNYGRSVFEDGGHNYLVKYLR